MNRTWASLEEVLIDAGISAEGREYIRRATARYRADARQQAASGAALQAAHAILGEDSAAALKIAAVLAAIEVEASHHRSERAEWARSLGKGRAEATDGPAWTAAIAAAGREMSPNYPPEPSDLAVVVRRANELGWTRLEEDARRYAGRRLTGAAVRAAEARDSAASTAEVAAADARALAWDAAIRGDVQAAKAAAAAAEAAITAAVQAAIEADA